MKRDLNKNIIDDIQYNHLNLPTIIPLGAKGNINYVYDAVGTKLQKNVVTKFEVRTTDYAGGFIYENHEMKFLSQPEGYVANNAGIFSYIYQYKDHLGNVRLSYGDGNNDGIVNNADIVEENNYYPFGLKHKGYNSVVTSTNPGQKYKYNGKELQDDDILGFKLNVYDYGARNYDPALGRWMSIDPLAEISRRYSPYIYTNDNPVYFFDPDGMAVQEFTDGNTYTGTDAQELFKTLQAQSWGSSSNGGGEGEDPPKKDRLDDVITIRGQKYHKNTSNLFAKIGNKINSIFGGDSNYFVEHKPYDPVEEEMLSETINTGAGFVVGGAVGKVAGKGFGALLSKYGGNGLSKLAFADLQTLVRSSSTEMNAFFKSGGEVIPEKSVLQAYKELTVRILNGTGGAPASKATETAIRVQSQRLKMINDALKTLK
jgi:RHS repeat-associated protein